MPAPFEVTMCHRTVGARSTTRRPARRSSWPSWSARSPTATSRLRASRSTECGGTAGWRGAPDRARAGAGHGRDRDRKRRRARFGPRRGRAGCG